MLLAGRVDSIIGNSLILKSIIAENKVESKVRAVKPYIALTPVYIALAKDIKGLRRNQKKHWKNSV